MEAIFREKDGAERLVGYSKLEYSSSDDTKKVVKISESELDGLVPDSFEGGWKENKEYFKLDESGEIVFDEGYTPPEPTGGS